MSARPIEKPILPMCWLCAEDCEPTDRLPWIASTNSVAHFACVMRAALKWRRKVDGGGKVLVFTRKSGPAFNPKGDSR